MPNDLWTAVTNPKWALQRIYYHALKQTGHYDYRRFIVLTRSRTGSYMLLSYLNSHPNIEAHGEILNRLKGNDYKLVINKIFCRKPYYIKAAGFKIFYYHPLDDKSCTVWDYLKDMEDICVIHLKRKNILRTLISRKIAGKQDVWMRTGQDDKNSTIEKAVTFTADELLEGFGKTRAWEKYGDTLFSKHDNVTVYYEDLLNDIHGEFLRITKLLGVRGLKPKTRLLKQNPERMSNLVTNYDELKYLFAGSEWEEFFNE